MNKAQYFKDLEIIKQDKIYIGSSKGELNKEIRNNFWSISIENDLLKHIKTEDFVLYFNEVIANRKTQIKESLEEQGMIFYLWFDVMANQLRFNLISDFHEQLPFGCELHEIEKIEGIIDEFLKSQTNQRMILEEINEEQTDEEQIDEEKYVLNIYRKHLIKEYLGE